MGSFTLFWIIYWVNWFSHSQSTHVACHPACWAPKPILNLIWLDRSQVQNADFLPVWRIGCICWSCFIIFNFNIGTDVLDCRVTANSFPNQFGFNFHASIFTRLAVLVSKCDQLWYFRAVTVDFIWSLAIFWVTNLAQRNLSQGNNQLLVGFLKQRESPSKMHFLLIFNVTIASGNTIHLSVQECHISVSLGKKDEKVAVTQQHHSLRFSPTNSKNRGNGI